MRHLSVIFLSLLLCASCGNSKKNDQKKIDQTEENAGDSIKDEASTETENQSEDLHDPWTDQDLMAPEVLADKIENGEIDSTQVLSIGFENIIKNSTQLGPVKDEAHLEELRKYLKDVPKDEHLVLYCGCCPFEKCPNIRPAMKLVKEMGFKNAKLLNLKESVKADWIDQGYPTHGSQD